MKRLLILMAVLYCIVAYGSPEAPLKTKSGKAQPEAIILLPLPKAQAGWVQYQSISPERPKLKLLWAHVYRRADGKVGVTVKLKNVGGIPCKRCWLLLTLKQKSTPEEFPWKSWILVKSDQKPAAKPGAVWSISRRCEDTKFNVVSWQLEFNSIAGPKDP